MPHCGLVLVRISNQELVYLKFYKNSIVSYTIVAVDCDIASYADDKTLYASSSNLDTVIKKLEESTNDLFQWFRNNHMKANADKCHVLVTGNYEVSANINKFGTESSKKEKLLGISIDTRLSFEHHITSLCKKVSQKLHVLARIVLYVLRKTKILNESIFNISI